MEKLIKTALTKKDTRHVHQMLTTIDYEDDNLYEDIPLLPCLPGNSYLDIEAHECNFVFYDTGTELHPLLPLRHQLLQYWKASRLKQPEKLLCSCQPQKRVGRALEQCHEDGRASAVVQNEMSRNLQSLRIFGNF
ncbi:hypothetical protein SRHO_G00170830 [Serrasalmus rhombeus]